MDIRARILAQFNEVLAESGGRAVPELADDAVLLQTGLDSLGWAILVARLESELGYDPFSLMKEPYYPTTFGDFCRVYREHAPR